jgi:hypothetical protein
MLMTGSDPATTTAPILQLVRLRGVIRTDVPSSDAAIGILQALVEGVAAGGIAEPDEP